MKKIVMGILMSFFILQANADSAFDEVQQMAWQGDAKAQFDLAMRYYSGRGVEKDEALSLQWLIESANQDYPEALWRLGYGYENGAFGLEKNFETAKDWYLKMAEQGDLYEQSINGYASVGMMYLTTDNNFADYSKGIEWLDRAYENGHMLSATMLGELYYTGGNGVPQNYSMAMGWFERAANGDEMTAMRYLAIMYLEGSASAPDFDKGHAWLIKAADRGEPTAKRVLGMIEAL